MAALDVAPTQRRARQRARIAAAAVVVLTVSFAVVLGVLGSRGSATPPAAVAHLHATPTSRQPTAHTTDAASTLVEWSPASSTVDVEWLHGACDELAGGSASGSATSVTVVLRARADVVKPCVAVLERTLVEVRLGSPLGARAVLGACQRATTSICVPASSPPTSTTPMPVVGP